MVLNSVSEAQALNSRAAYSILSYASPISLYPFQRAGSRSRLLGMVEVGVETAVEEVINGL